MSPVGFDFGPVAKFRETFGYDYDVFGRFCPPESEWDPFYVEKERRDALTQEQRDIEDAARKAKYKADNLAEQAEAARIEALILTVVSEDDLMTYLGYTRDGERP